MANAFSTPGSPTSGQTLLAAWPAQRNIEDLEAKLREQEAWDAPQAEMNSAP